MFANMGKSKRVGALLAAVVCTVLVASAVGYYLTKAPDDGAKGENGGTSKTVPLEVIKEASVTQACIDDEVTYLIKVKNIGTVKLTDIVINDTLEGVFDDIPDLDAGDSTSITYRYRITEYDTSPLKSVAMVTAEDVNGRKYYAEANVSVVITDADDGTDEIDDGEEIPEPGIMVTKTASTMLADIGENIVYTIVVDNTGDTPLYNVTIVDSMGGQLCFLPVLEIDANHSITYSRIVGCNDTGMTLINIVNVTADYNGEIVTDSDSAIVQVVSPNVQIVLTGPLTANVGEMITYTINATNIGTTKLFDVRIIDAMLGVDELFGSLNVGASIVLSANFLVSGTGSIVSTALVTAEDSCGNVVSDTDTWTVGVTSARISLDKMSVEFATPGETIIYTFNVTNLAAVPLHNITIFDDMLGNFSVSDLDAGEFKEIMVAFEIPENASENITNHAVVVGYDPENTPVSDDASWTVALVGLRVCKVVQNVSIIMGEGNETCPNYVDFMGINITFVGKAGNTWHYIVRNCGPKKIYGWMLELPADRIMLSKCSIVKVDCHGNPISCPKELSDSKCQLVTKISTSKSKIPLIGLLFKVKIYPGEAIRFDFTISSDLPVGCAHVGIKIGSSHSYVAPTNIPGPIMCSCGQCPSCTYSLKALNETEAYCFNVKFVSHIGNSWTYRVTNNYFKKLYSWMLEVPVECVSVCNCMTMLVHPDGTPASCWKTLSSSKCKLVTKISSSKSKIPLLGIEFKVKIEPGQTMLFTFTLNGDLKEGPVSVGGKISSSHVFLFPCKIFGPISSQCGGCALEQGQCGTNCTNATCPQVAEFDGWKIIFAGNSGRTWSYIVSALCAPKKLHGFMIGMCADHVRIQSASMQEICADGTPIGCAKTLSGSKVKLVTKISSSSKIRMTGILIKEKVYPGKIVKFTFTLDRDLTKGCDNIGILYSSSKGCVLPTKIPGPVCCHCGKCSMAPGGEAFQNSTEALCVNVSFAGKVGNTWSYIVRNNGLSKIYGWMLEMCVEGVYVISCYMQKVHCDGTPASCPKELSHLKCQLVTKISTSKSKIPLKGLLFKVKVYPLEEIKFTFTLSTDLPIGPSFVGIKYASSKSLIAPEKIPGPNCCPLKCGFVSKAANVTYGVTVTNIGTVPLFNVTLVDSIVGFIFKLPVLLPGESMHATYSIILSFVNGKLIAINYANASSTFEGMFFNASASNVLNMTCPSFIPSNGTAPFFCPKPCSGPCPCSCKITFPHKCSKPCSNCYQMCHESSDHHHYGGSGDICPSCGSGDNYSGCGDICPSCGSGDNCGTNYGWWYGNQGQTNVPGNNENSNSNSNPNGMSYGNWDMNWTDEDSDEDVWGDDEPDDGTDYSFLDDEGEDDEE